MNHKTKNILKWTPSVFAGTMISLSGIFKLSHAAPLVEHYTQLGLVQYLPFFGMMELVLVVLFIYPRTLKLGLLLCTGYLGGAMAAELSHGNMVLPPMIILALVWMAAYLRNSSLFLVNEPNHSSFQIN